MFLAKQPIKAGACGGFIYRQQVTCLSTNAGVERGRLGDVLLSGRSEIDALFSLCFSIRKVFPWLVQLLP